MLTTRTCVVARVEDLVACACAVFLFISTEERIPLRRLNARQNLSLCDPIYQALRKRHRRRDAEAINQFVRARWDAIGGYILAPRAPWVYFVRERRYYSSYVPATDTVLDIPANLSVAKLARISFLYEREWIIPLLCTMVANDNGRCCVV